MELLRYVVIEYYCRPLHKDIARGPNYYLNLITPYLVSILLELLKEDRLSTCTKLMDKQLIL